MTTENPTPQKTSNSSAKDFGKQGEQIAADYLKGKGYKILDLNWRAGKHEVDIVAQDGRFLVIAEVKSRHSTFAGEPETAVTRDKQRCLISAANAYLKIKGLENEVRFDVVSILIMNEREIINHIPDAFYPV